MADLGPDFGGDRHSHLHSHFWCRGLRLDGEVLPAFQKDPEGWTAADKFTLVLETAGFNVTELSRSK